MVGVVLCTHHSPVVPLRRWEVEPGDALKAAGSAILVDVAENNMA